MLGAPVTSTATDDDQRRQIEEVIAAVMAGGESIHYEASRRRKDGAIIDLAITMSPIREPDGTIVGVSAVARDVSETKHAAAALAERERLLTEAQALAHVGSWEWDLRSPTIKCSDELNRIHGRPPGFEPTFDEVIATVHPDDVDAVRAGFAAVEKGPPTESEYRIIRPDGEVRDVHARRSTRTDESGVVTHLVGTLQDITDRKRAERELRQAQEHTEAIVSSMSEGYGLTVKGVITTVNDALCELTGFSREELIGCVPPYPFWPPETLSESELIRQRVVAQEGGTFEIKLMRKDGTRFVSQITARAARKPDGSLLGFVNTFRDISASKRYEAELERLASHDPLTGLPNHRAFHERLGEEVARARRHDRPLSVAILDLDHFKRINDQFGHPTGDRVLVEIANRLGSLVRDGELLARVGGEEFAWILPDADGVGAFAAVERARQAVGAIQGLPDGKMTLSAGVCDLVHAADVTELYARADHALYWAKDQGRDQTFRYSAHTAEHLDAARRRRSDEDRARTQSLEELAMAADAKHADSAGHAKRVADLACRLAEHAGWTEVEISQMRRAALMHDIGKVAVPDSIIAKGVGLADAERAQLETHAAIGAEMLSATLTADQVAWVRHHHERWDGAGYPAALQGRSIPEGARLLAIADAFDAMTHNRPYRDALGQELALLEIQANAGTQFAPDAVKLLELALVEGMPQRAGADD